ncbi:hypothetical protein DIPPA_06412 [Diplonema papillatum]|nr:hypothetical protein DIPPA_06412 [Diplonema papillatum]KAJ9467143.1 hypothetical protein DIPPA_06412 [Diplonema papillatum]
MPSGRFVAILGVAVGALLVVAVGQFQRRGEPGEAALEVGDGRKSQGHEQGRNQGHEQGQNQGHEQGLEPPPAGGAGQPREDPGPAASAMGSSLLRLIGFEPGRRKKPGDPAAAAPPGGASPWRDALLNVRGQFSAPAVPWYLSREAAPPGCVVHEELGPHSCPAAAAAAAARENDTVIRCVDSCAPPACQYAAVSEEGTCSHFSDCPFLEETERRSTVYAVGDAVFSREHHREHREPRVSHLWRVNKTVRSLRQYSAGPVELPGCVSRIFAAEYDRAGRKDAEDTSVPELGVDHVYMVHYTPLVTRRRVIAHLQAQQGIRADWVTSFDHQNISADSRRCLHEAWEPATYSNPKKKARQVPSASTPQGFSGGELSVAVKHHFVYYDMVRKNYTFAVVFEDDAKLRVGFRQHFAEAVRAVPPDFDIIVFGGCLRLYGWRMHKQLTVPVSKHVYRKDMTRCAHAYALTLAAAKKLLSAMPLTEVIDYQINRAIVESGMKVYWIEPWLSVQGPVGEAGQPRKTATTGGDGEPYEVRNLKDPSWIRTWQKGVPPQPVDVIKIPKSSSNPACHKRTKECWWL